MFVRGSTHGNEYRREDTSFYRGVVVRNDDPLQMSRVKVFIPEISNQPFDNWYAEYEQMILKLPGNNDENGNWSDINIFDEIIKKLPWAEIMYPVIGESSNARYFSDTGTSTISDANYPENFNKIDNNPPNLIDGSFAPAYLYDNYQTSVMDSMTNPTTNWTVKNNPYSACYRPNKNTNMTKGLIGIPEIGAKVWVTHNMGDLNFPIVIGVMQDLRSLKNINYNNNYPRNSENKYVNE
jgi:hypothetical protein